MRGAGLRRVSAAAEMRIGGWSGSAWLLEVGGRQARVGLREADAAAGRDRAAEGVELSLRLRAAGGGAWARVSDFRLGPALGSGARAVRSATVDLAEDAEGWDSAALSRLAPAVVAVDDEAAASSLRGVPRLAGIEVVPVGEVRDDDAVGALLLGCRPPHDPAEAAVRPLVENFPGLRPILVARGGASSGWRSELAATGAAFFVCRGWPEPRLLAGLALAAAEQAVLRRAHRALFGETDGDEYEIPERDWYDSASLRQRRAVQQTLGDLAARAEQRMPEAVASVYACDDWADALVGPQPVAEAESVDSAAVGSISYAARAGVSVEEPRPEESVFYDPALDAAPMAGRGLAALPIRDLSGTVLGVLTLRPRNEEGRLARGWVPAGRLLARDFSAPLSALREEQRLEGGGGPADPSIFRPEALEEHRRADRGASSILDVSERWGNWIVVALAALLAGFFTFLVLGRSTEYAEGAAFVHSLGRTPVVANAAGTVEEVRLTPGAPVRAGAVIGALYDANELALVQRLEQEYEENLVRYLRYPDEPGAGSGLAALRATSREARAALEARAFTAPVDGVLADILVQVGAVVAPGQTVAAIHSEDAEFEIVAAVPGNYRPLLHSGLQVEAELDQFPGIPLHLTARSVSAEVVEGEEARALLRRPLPEEFTGRPVALVYADLPASVVYEFGPEHSVYDGMTGRVRIPVRQERFLVSLWPSLGR